MTTAYVDQETGQRGFLITGDPAFLQPYTQGQTNAARLGAELATLLTDEPSVMKQLDAVTDRAQSWAASAASEITGRQSGAWTQPELSASAPADKQLFDALRVALANLGAATDQLTNAQLRAISTAQTIANTVTAAAVALAVGVAALSVWAIRQHLTRPLRRLQTQVQQVAGGDYHRPIVVDGPDEVVSIADSVNSMRENLLRHSADLVAAEHTVTLIEEKDRVAAALHDGATQRLFRLGLALTSAARRHPRLAEQFTALVTETDHVMQDLRAVALELSTTSITEDLVVQVSNAVDTTAAAMGFVPTVDVVGPVATQSTDTTTAEIVTVVTEVLPGITAHARATAATVTLAAEPAAITVTIAVTRTDTPPVGAVAPTSLPTWDGIDALAAQFGRIPHLATDSAGQLIFHWTTPTPIADHGDDPYRSAQRAATGPGTKPDTRRPTQRYSGSRAPD